MEECNEIGFQIRRMDNLMMRNMLSYVRTMGLDEVTVMNGWILRYLYDNPDKDIYQRDLEQECCIGRSTVTNIVKLMEKKQMIERVSVPQDARLKKLILTEKGRSSHEKIKGMLDILEEKLHVGISNEEIEIFMKILHKFNRNLKQQEEEIKCLKH